MKVAIYGGTFNPIHKGHVSLAQSLVAQGLVDEVWLLVSPLNPFKQAQTTEFAPYADRFRMAELAVCRKRGLRASDFETQLPVPSYTIHTLDALSAAYPEHEFCLVIGADNWQAFGKWYHGDEILSRYQILIYRRPGYDISLDSIGDSEDVIHPRIVDTPLYDISSTQLRQQLREGRKPRKWLSVKVMKYIAENNLYK